MDIECSNIKPIVKRKTAKLVHNKFKVIIQNGEEYVFTAIPILVFLYYVTCVFC